MTLLQRLIRRLQMEQTDAHTYIGGAGTGGVTEASRLFGGLVAAQATMAAALDAPEFPIHSLHAYFLRPGRPDADIEYVVDTPKHGRNFHVRNVTAMQAGEAIFQLQASFQRPESGVAHAQPMPETDLPEALPNRDQLRGRKNWQDMPIDVRMVTPITEDQPLPPEQQVWLRVNGELPRDEKLHAAMIVYASDRTLLDTAWRPHAGQGQMRGASLDHSIWFHQPPVFDGWLLYDMHSPAAANGRGLAWGGLYNVPDGPENIDRANGINKDSQRIASVAQEGVIRVI